MIAYRRIVRDHPDAPVHEREGQPPGPQPRVREGDDREEELRDIFSRPAKLKIRIVQGREFQLRFNSANCNGSAKGLR